jgi:hypothetical protein
MAAASTAVVVVADDESKVDYDVIAGRKPDSATSTAAAPPTEKRTLLNDGEVKFLHDHAAKRDAAMKALRNPVRPHVNAAGDTRVSRMEDPVDKLIPATPSQALAAIACRLNDDPRFVHPSQHMWLEYALTFAPKAISDRAGKMATPANRMDCIAAVRTENYRIAAAAQQARATLEEVATLKTLNIGDINEAHTLVPSLQRFHSTSPQLQEFLHRIHGVESSATLAE